MPPKHDMALQLFIFIPSFFILTLIIAQYTLYYLSNSMTGVEQLSVDSGYYQRPSRPKLRDQIPDSPFLLKLEKQWAQGKFLCVGLDPAYEKIPAEFKQTSIEETLVLFVKTIVDATHHNACAFKPNLAFYEEHGEEGRRALVRITDYIANTYPDIVVILDSKRGDIGKTNKRYARADLGKMAVDALTLQSYFGGESLDPFLQRLDKGHIVLARTSNVGSDEIQTAPLRGKDRSTANRVARLAAEKWNKNGTIALVVGATYPEHLAQLRALAGDMPILAPGIGTQGGDLERTVRAGLDSRGMGLLVNVSSGISEAKRLADESMADAMRRVSDSYRVQIGEATKLPRLVHGQVDLAEHPEGLTTSQEELLLEMLDWGIFKTGEFKLKYHATHADCPHMSPIYFNLRVLRRHPKAKWLAAEVYEELLSGLDFDLLADVPTGATPVTSTLADNLETGMVTPRTDKKSYGSGATVDGFETEDEGKTVVAVEDVATTGGSTLEAVKALRAVRAEVRDVLVLIDREQGAREKLGQEGVELHAAYTLEKMFAFYVRKGRFTSEQIEQIKSQMATLTEYMQRHP